MKLHRHFVPHTYPPIKPGNRYHRAHLISNKSLFVYFQLLLVFGVFTFFLRSKDTQILGTITFSSREIVALSNAEREKNGLIALSENPLLQQAAEAKAADMLASDYWAHYSPSGKSPWGFITGAGYKYVYAGENLARDFDDANEVVGAWMNSTSHRANLLDRNFREIGVAVVDGELGGREGILVVQMFGSSNVSAPASSSAGDKDELALSPVRGEQVKLEPVVAVKPGWFSPGFSTTRAVSLALVGFIFMLFLVEAVVSLKTAHMKLQPQVIAHLLLLGLSIMALWYSANGAII